MDTLRPSPQNTFAARYENARPVASVIPIDRVTAKSVNASSPKPTRLVRNEYSTALSVDLPSKDGVSDSESAVGHLPSVVCGNRPPSKDGVSGSEWSPQEQRRRECQLKIE